MKYSLTSSTFGVEEKQAMVSVIDSDMFTMGRHVREFEEQFASYMGMKHAVMVNSGSSANVIAVASLFFRSKAPLRRGDEVIVPCISWATTYYPLHQYGLKLRFVDVDLHTLNYDIDELRKAITPQTKMVVAVSILGNPCDFTAIQEICNHHGIILFEDNCESLGATHKGRYTGTFGLLNTFSTFFSHHISTMEGGLVLTNDHELYCLCRSLRNHGWTRDQDPGSVIFNRRDDDFYEAYRFILPGYNVRPTELQGGVGKEQLKKLRGFIDTRIANAAHFTGLFKDDERFIIQRPVGPDSVSSSFCFTMIVNPKAGVDRGRVLQRLREAEIEHRIITGGNFLRHDVIKYFDYEVTGSSNADIAHDYGFFVGNHPIDIRAEIDYLHKTLKNV
ncbi:MAG: DegT/DnrJ/EryC1/StrS family aminotransferase [Nitrospirae bacterium]|uniref:DegT/DnrJ/EryC1/StrS family aminotransferase n=1 Tax=Candidatus Magnetobacterium casense TaxID=1455061 RepID=UPI00058F546E|nr:DegT/DnrJ/EryC1/StrS family aminotransferase [Candidatus Magnetobacterium casensis]MBF0337582.1 DegT/DnrJ/EryC1/StrS family aminotransferase [Nitrospirota bacterium]